MERHLRAIVLVSCGLVALVTSGPATATTETTPDLSVDAGTVLPDPSSSLDQRDRDSGSGDGGVESASPSPGLAVPRSAPGNELAGTFHLERGECTEAGVTEGSWFRMLDPGGENYVSNSSSPCGDRTWTPLSPGTDGGLMTTGYQPHPDPAFSGGVAGNAVADRIMQPQGFNGVDFSVGTQDTDPQTGDPVPVPTILEDGGALTGDLSAWNAAWNGQFFNQGAPKPDGSTPGQTALPSGTYDAASGGYRLEWRSLIVGGPFDGFTGIWHLTGTFESAAAPGTDSQPGGTPTTATGPGESDSALSADDGTDADPATRPVASGTLPRTGATASALLGSILTLVGLGGFTFARRQIR